MKRWIRNTLIAVVSATALLGGLGAWAHNRMHAWHNLSEQDVAAMKQKMVERVATQLQLDATQKAKLGVLADRINEQRLALKAGSADPRAEVQSLVAGNTFDRAKAMQMLNAKVVAVQTKSPEVVAALGDFYDSLNPAQQQKVRDFMARHRHHGPHGQDVGELGGNDMTGHGG